MQRRGHSCRLPALAVALGLAALPAPLLASGFQLVEQNASGLGNAFAGQAAGVKNASAVFFNPAALTQVKGLNIVASVDPIGLGIKFHNAGTVGPFVPTAAGPSSFPVPLGDEGGDAGSWIPVPNGYVSWQASERVWLGAGVNVPFGLETDWEQSFMGRFYATKSKVQTLNVNPTVAVKVTDQLSLGAGVNWQHLKADLGQNVPYGSLAYAGSAQALAAQGLPAATQQALLGMIVAQLGGTAGLATEGPTLVSGTSDAWGWNVGAHLNVDDRLRLGVSYRSKVNHDKVEGTVTFTGAPALLESGLTGPIGTAINARFASGAVTTAIEMPDTFSAAASYEEGKVEVLADWTYTGWDTITSLDINRADASALSSVPLKFRNTWRAGLGLNYKLDEQWTLRLGTAYDKSPVQDVHRTPRLPDNNRTWASAGFQWRANDKVHVDVGYAHLFVPKGSSDLELASTSGSLIGSYDEKVDILGAQLTLRF